MFSKDRIRSVLNKFISVLNENLKPILLIFVVGSSIILLFCAYFIITGNLELAIWSGIMELSLIPIAIVSSVLVSIGTKYIKFRTAKKKYLDYLINISDDQSQNQIIFHSGVNLREVKLDDYFISHVFERIEIER